MKRLIQSISLLIYFTVCLQTCLFSVFNVLNVLQICLKKICRNKLELGTNLEPPLVILLSRIQLPGLNICGEETSRGKKGGLRISCLLKVSKGQWEIQEPKLEVPTIYIHI